MSIIDEANPSRQDRITGPLELFRGLKLDKEEVNMYKGLARRKASYQMLGYTSTSRNKGEAIKFAIEDVQPDQSPVIFRIRMQNESGKYMFSMDSEAYSMYPEEEEVLIQQGLPFTVMAVEEREDTESQSKYTEILIDTSESLIFKKRVFELIRILASFAIFNLGSLY